MQIWQHLQARSGQAGHQKGAEPPGLIYTEGPAVAVTEAGLVRHLEHQLESGKATVLLASGCAAVRSWAGKQGELGCQWLACAAGEKPLQLLQAAAAESVRHLKTTSLQSGFVGSWE